MIMSIVIGVLVATEFATAAKPVRFFRTNRKYGCSSYTEISPGETVHLNVNKRIDPFLSASESCQWWITTKTRLVVQCHLLEDFNMRSWPESMFMDRMAGGKGNDCLDGVFFGDVERSLFDKSEPCKTEAVGSCYFLCTKASVTFQTEKTTLIVYLSNNPIFGYRKRDVRNLKCTVKATREVVE